MVMEQTGYQSNQSLQIYKEMSEGPVGEKGEMGDTGPPSVQGLTALRDCVSCNCYTLAIHLCICNLLQCFQSNDLVMDWSKEWDNYIVAMWEHKIYKTHLEHPW